jgi:hypothetical protein
MRDYHPIQLNVPHVHEHSSLSIYHLFKQWVSNKNRPVEMCQHGIADSVMKLGQQGA